MRVNFDSPYIKGLPTTMTIWEKIGEDRFQGRYVRKTYQDAYTKELMELYDCAIHEKAPKTSAADARNDVELFRMILQADAGRYKEQP